MAARKQLLSTVAIAAFISNINTYTVNAQDASIDQEESSIAVTDTIIVTARKKGESLQDAPLAIAAFGETELNEGGFTNILDISKATPGLFIEKNNNTFARVNSTPRFRGVYLATGNRLQQTATVFLDGISLNGGVETIGVNELQRVEVIKGPQSALFGRNTFSGAINFVTKDPSDEFRADINVTTATRNEYRGAASLEGPINDVISYRIGGSWDSSDGHYDNYAVAGQRLGDESQWNINGTLLFESSESFRLKLRGSYREVHDGPAAAIGGISGPLDHNFGGYLVNADGSVNTSDSIIPNSNTPGVRTNSIFRGKIIGSSIPASEIGINSGPADVMAFRNAFQNDGRFSGDEAILNDFKYSPLNQDEFGLDLDEIRFSADTSFDVTEGISFSFLAGYSRERYGFFSDFDLTPDRSFSGYQTSEITDFSMEGRFDGKILSDKISWAVGASYVDIDIEGANGTISTFGSPIVFGDIFRSESFKTGAQTTGIFGSLDFQFTDQISFTAEGRYQEDKIREDDVNAKLSVPISPTTLKNFLPRLTLRYEPSDSTTLYATYSEGNLPGGFNPQVAELDPAALAQLNALAPGITNTFAEETLKNYELGWKQSLMNGHAAFNLAAFYMQRGDEIFRAINVVDDNRAGAVNPTRTVAYNGNGATTNIYGFEIDASWFVTDELTVSVSAAYVDAKIASFPEGGGTGRFGLVYGAEADISGQRAPRFPPLAFSASANYERSFKESIGAFDRWFVRGDFYYTGNYYITNANLAEVEVATDVNLRFGVRGDNASIEIYATNVLGEEAPSAARTMANTSFDTRTAPGGFFNFNSLGSRFSLRDKRQFGVRLGYTF